MRRVLGEKSWNSRQHDWNIHRDILRVGAGTGVQTVSQEAQQVTSILT